MEEVDNLPYKEQMALSPQMGQYFGSYTTKLPKAPPQGPKPSHKQLENMAREYAPAEVAAKAAARNLGIRVEPFRVNAQPSSTQEYYDLALESLHAIPRHMQQTLRYENTHIRYEPRGRRITVNTNSVEGDPGSYYERKVRGRSTQSLHQRPLGVFVERKAATQNAQSQALSDAPAAEDARKQQLAQVGSPCITITTGDCNGASVGVGGASIISAIKEGGQAYVDKLEAELADAQSTAATAKKVIDTLHDPGAQLIPAGFANSDEEAPQFARRPAVIWNSPTAIRPPYPERFEGVVPPPHPAVLQGVPYPVVVPGNPYSTIYGQFVNYGPMKRWAGVCVRVCVCVSVCARARVYVCMYACMYVYTYIYI